MSVHVKYMQINGIKNDVGQVFEKFIIFNSQLTLGILWYA